MKKKKQKSRRYLTEFLDKVESADMVVDCYSTDAFQFFAYLKKLSSIDAKRLKCIELIVDNGVSRLWEYVPTLFPNMSFKIINADDITDDEFNVCVNLVFRVVEKNLYENEHNFIIVSSNTDFESMKKMDESVKIFAICDKEKTSKETFATFKKCKIRYDFLPKEQDQICKNSYSKVDYIGILLFLKMLNSDLEKVLNSILKAQVLNT